MATQVQVAFDCAEPGKLADFWAGALGYVVQPPPPGYASWGDLLQEMGVPEDRWDSRSAVVDPDGRGPRIFFQKVPEGKERKNRVHLDVQVGAGMPPAERPAMVAREVDRLVGLGAEQVEVFDETGEHWVVMRDPEGNEFCVS